MNMAENERNNYKGNIVCIECGGEAYYRDKSVDGKSPCFCAKHIGLCDMKNSNKSKSSEGYENVDSIEVDTSEYYINWNYITKNNVCSDKNNKNDENTIVKNKKVYSKDSDSKKQLKISLNQILKYAELDILKSQSYEIIIKNTRYILSDVVINLEKICGKHLSKEMFFWGKVSSINGVFINTKYPNSISIIIDEDAKESFEQNYKDKLLKLLDNNHMIVFGRLIKKKDKYYIIVKNTKNIYFRKPYRK